MNEHVPRQLDDTWEKVETYSRWPRFLKSYLEFGIKLAKVNVAGAEQDGFGPPVKRSQLPLWSHAAEIYCYYFTLKTLVNLVLQNNYDRVIHEYKTSGASNSTWQLRQEKEAELARAIELVEVLGNPFYKLGPLLEIASILTVIFIIHVYVEVRIYNHLCGPIRVGVARLFLDPKLERELAVKNELTPLINIFIRSAVNYSVASKRILARSRRELARSSRESITTDLSLEREFQDLKLHQVENVEILRDMAASGELDQLNRRPEWTRTLAHTYSALVLFFQGIFAIFLIFLVIVSPWTGSFGVDLHYGWRGILYTIEYLVYYPLQTQWVFFPILLISMSTLDEIVYALALKRMVTKLADDIAANGVDLTSGLATRRLLRVLIQYRLLKRQLCSTKPFVGFIAASMISATLLGPALARVYASQVCPEVRYMYTIYCLLTILAADISILPACYLHVRCLELYRAMSYLLAHLDSVNQFNHTSKKHIDEHTLRLLRRELHQPDFATHQFSTDAHFIRLTYGNLMRVHFYCGLWLVPMFMRDTSGLGSATSDFIDLL